MFWPATFIVIALLVSLCRWLWSYQRVRNEEGKELEPVGGRGWKNLFGLLVAFIGRKKHQRLVKDIAPSKLEQFQPLEPDHDYFNESFYFHNTDEASGDMVILRVSRRGRKGKVSYVFLVIHSKQLPEYVLRLECDNVPIEDRWKPKVKGLQLVCEEPLKQWRILYKGKMALHAPGSQDVVDPDGKGVLSAQVEVDLRFSAQTPRYMYFMDDDAVCIGRNIAQEPWTINFWKSCLRRGSHAHYEQYGYSKGTVEVSNLPSKVPLLLEYAKMGVFRDHSWDIRRWASIDVLFIALCTLTEPLVLNGVSYNFLNITLCDMPGNDSGLQRFSSGWLGAADSVLPLRFVTSLDHLQYSNDPSDDSRRTPPEGPTTLHCVTAAGHFLRIRSGKRPGLSHFPRLLYFPDDHEFEVFEDSALFFIDILPTSKSPSSKSHDASGFGGRQYGFYTGFD